MKTLLKTIAIFLSLFLIFFLAISLYYITFDIRLWDAGARFMLSFCLIISTIISISCSQINK